MNTEKTLQLHRRWLRSESGGARADLSGADLSRANLSRADLSRANLSGANLYGADLYGADLSGANLSRANLSEANLYGADLSGADLYGADLSGADLSGADLSEADLSEANLSEANLSGADLSGANGVFYADCSWTDHGEAGRRLLAIRCDSIKGVRYFCGCFQGNAEELEEYIAHGKPHLAPSRALAFRFVRDRMEATT